MQLTEMSRKMLSWKKEPRAFAMQRFTTSRLQPERRSAGKRKSVSTTKDDSSSESEERDWEAQKMVGSFQGAATGREPLPLPASASAHADAMSLPS